MKIPPLNQFEIEKRFRELVKYGEFTPIGQHLGRSEKYVSRLFDPDDPDAVNPLFRTAEMLRALMLTREGLETDVLAVFSDLIHSWRGQTDFDPTTLPQLFSSFNSISVEAINAQLLQLRMADRLAAVRRARAALEKIEQGLMSLDME